MATILRSSKYVRNFAEFATKIGFSHIKADSRVSLLTQRNFAPSTLSKSLATQVAAKQLENESNLENTLRRLDHNVKRYGRISRAQLERILNAFQSSKSVTGTQALMVIRCCGSLVADELPESRSELVNQVWKTLESSGVQLDLSHYNALLRVYIENEYAFSPTEVLAELERKGIEPNKLTYQRLITRYCQQGDIEGASKILEFMREKEISVNENIFTALVRGHSEANDMASAADILSVMRQAGLEPSADTYKELLCGYAKRGDVVSITNTLSECEEKGVHLLDTDFLDVTFALASNGHGALVEAILSVMPKEVGYLQDALNHVLKLVHVGQVDIAMQVLRSIPNRDKGSSGASIIKQLAKSDLPLSTILEFCKEIESKGINSRASLIALEANLLQGNVEGSLTFLQALQESNLEVREHYFWPIFIALGRSKNDAGINDLLKSMRIEYGIVISGETLRDYVIPNKSGEPHEILADLTMAGSSTGSVAHAIVYNLVLQMKIKEAAEFATQHAFRYNAVMFSRPLAAALAQTKDVQSFVTILGHIYENRFNATNIRNQTVTVDNKILEPYVIDVATYIKDEKSELLTQVLEALLAAGHNISETGISSIQRAVNNRSTPDLNRLLNRFKSKGSTGVPLPATDSSASRRAEIARLEESVDRFNSNDEIANNTRKRLLYLYSRVKDLPNLERIVTELKDQGVEFTDNMYRQLLDAYINSDVLDKSEECLIQLKQVNPSYKLDDTKLAKYIILLVKNDRLDDAVRFLKNQSNIQMNNNSRRTTSWWRLLNDLAELGETKAVNAIFEVLSQNEYMDISSPNLGPLVKVHIVRNDLMEALNVFEKICETYQHTPLKNELTKKLIEAEDATALQRLTDLSTQVHGESNSLYDLAQSFIESNCLRQAKKILEIPALHPKSHRLKIASKRYSEQGMTIYLERLVSVVQELPFFKVIPDFYEDLMTCYNKEDNWEKGLNLKKQLEEAEIEPSHAFLVTLTQLLQRNNQPVPFALPQGVIVPKSAGFQASRAVKSSATRQQEDDGNNDSDTKSPKRIWNRAKEETALIESLVQNGQLRSAFEITHALAERNLYPGHRTFRFLIRRAGQTGEIELLENLEKHLPVPMKKAVDFDNNTCHAYVVAGKAAEYIDILEKKLEVTDESDSNQGLGEFPVVGIRYLLEQQPELTEKYTKLAEKYATRGNMVPINALWMHYFIRGQPEADKIWSEYLVKSPKVLFHSIVRIAQKDNNTELLRRLIKTFETGPLIDKNSKGFAYSELIKLSYVNGNYQESVDILREALNVISVDNIPQSTLGQMKSYLAAKGLALPADIFSESQSTEARERIIT